MFQVMPVIDFKTDSSSHNPYLEQNANKYEDKYQDLCKLKLVHYELCIAKTFIIKKFQAIKMVIFFSENFINTFG